MTTDKMLLIAGNANRPLAQAIAKHLKLQLTKADVSAFSEGETQVQILDDVRGGDVFLVQPTCPPSNQNMMELLVMLDALRRASTERITAVMPYFGYARQDRKDRPRVPITAKLVANLLTVAGADRVLTMDLHAHQIQGFFDIPLDHLYALPVFIEHIKKQKIDDPVIVAPDVGALKMARGYATRMELDLAVVDKRRVDHQKTEVMNILGDIGGRNVIIVDDVTSTAGSICEAAVSLKKQGATSVYAAISHGILAGSAIERVAASPIEKLWVTDSVLLSKEQRHPKIGVVSIAPLFAEAIKRIHRAESISSLFS